MPSNLTPSSQQRHSVPDNQWIDPPILASGDSYSKESMNLPVLDTSLDQVSENDYDQFSTPLDLEVVASITRLIEEILDSQYAVQNQMGDAAGDPTLDILPVASDLDYQDSRSSVSLPAEPLLASMTPVNQDSYHTVHGAIEDSFHPPGINPSPHIPMGAFSGAWRRDDERALMGHAGPSRSDKQYYDHTQPLNEQGMALQQITAGSLSGGLFPSESYPSTYRQATQLPHTMGTAYSVPPQQRLDVTGDSFYPQISEPTYPIDKWDAIPAHGNRMPSLISQSEIGYEHLQQGVSYHRTRTAQAVTGGSNNHHPTASFTLEREEKRSQLISINDGYDIGSGPSNGHVEQPINDPQTYDGRGSEQPAFKRGEDIGRAGSMSRKRQYENSGTESESAESSRKIKRAKGTKSESTDLVPNFRDMEEAAGAPVPRQLKPKVPKMMKAYSHAIVKLETPDSKGKGRKWHFVPTGSSESEEAASKAFGSGQQSISMDNVRVETGRPDLSKPKRTRRCEK
ncbi:hypothetical protein JR316_0008651 [Psilocybe cubensis]|uniref:Uncharacterized protein n=2 Tax=Psilocybe cubensis TaxID=181762 RepID=A0ACB8GRP0_PSICU|nr:hypothetical protein JR316_0008651 [Psilocybe cubensis]KAH9478198.1 hypothetical protein JR316_0008651 [Psilocybe cubensis]